MKNEFVSYEQALALKELGFDEECFGVYYHDGQLVEQLWEKLNISKKEEPHILAPLYQQAFRLFREKYGFIHRIDKELRGNLPILYSSYACNSETDFRTTQSLSYEEAELACLNKLIEIVKNNKV